MKRKNLLIILSIILLIIICAMSYIFIFEGNNNINNNSDSNSTDLKLNNSIDKNNNSLNNNSLNNNSNIDENLSNSDYNPSSGNNQGKDSDEYYDEAMEAKLGVEKYALGKNEIAGYPVYKHPRLDSWLVPIFDKNTKKFVGSIYIYKGGAGFVMGPQYYSQYKEVISGNTHHKSDSNKHVAVDKSKTDVSDKTQERIVGGVGKSNSNSQDALDENILLNVENSIYHSQEIILNNELNNNST